MTRSRNSHLTDQEKKIERILSQFDKGKVPPPGTETNEKAIVIKVTDGKTVVLSPYQKAAAEVCWAAVKLPIMSFGFMFLSLDHLLNTLPFTIAAGCVTGVCCATVLGAAATGPGFLAAFAAGHVVAAVREAPKMKRTLKELWNTLPPNIPA
ncbi:MAG: hypothetical protein PHE27_03965 [Alphaproteobacteria bacterium]|nr:hypothetical protein [Alphaproteobacteria bacterium]